MNQEISIPPIRFYIFYSFMLSTLFLTVALLLLAIWGDFKEGFLLILVLNFIFSPVVGILGWLIDKGSRGENRSIVLKTVGGIAGMSYGAIAGAIVAAEILGSIASTVGFITFFCLGLVAGSRIGPTMGESLARIMRIRI